MGLGFGIIGVWGLGLLGFRIFGDLGHLGLGFRVIWVLGLGVWIWGFKVLRHPNTAAQALSFCVC